MAWHSSAWRDVAYSPSSQAPARQDRVGVRAGMERGGGEVWGFGRGGVGWGCPREGLDRVL